MDAELTFEQLDFLEKNLVVYDPATRQTYQEFGAIRGRKAFLLGEMHHTNTHREIQNEFLRLFAGPDSCLLPEGLRPGQSLKAEETIWPNIPPGMAILGSDIRMDRDQDYNIEKQIREITKEKVSKFKNHFRQMATIINEEIRSGRAYPLNGKVVLPKRVFDQVTRLHQEFTSSLEKLNTTLEELVEASTDTSPLAHRESNQGLLQTIIKTAKQYKQVHSIYGEAHFYDGDELLQGLEKENISFVILFPNQKRKEEAKNEYKLVTDNVREFKFEIETPEPLSRASLSVPKLFKDFFLPDVQSVFVLEPKVKKIYFSDLNFAEMDPESVKFTFPANTSIRMLDVDPEYFHPLGELHDLMEEKKIEAKKAESELFSNLGPVVNSLLLFHRACVKRMHFPGVVLFSPISKNRTQGISVRSPEAFSLEIERGTMKTRSEFLFKEMRRKNLDIFKLKARETLILTDITSEDKEIISKDSARFAEILTQKAPKDRKAGFKGNLSIAYRNDGLSISSYSNFAVTLTPLLNK